MIGEKENVIEYNKLMQALFSFEGAFVLFLYAGKFKLWDAVASFPIDLTLFFYFLSIGIGLGVVVVSFGGVKNISFDRGFWLFLAFVLWFDLSVLWSPGKVYAAHKLSLLTFSVAWSYVAPLYIVSKDLVRLKRFFLMVFFMSLLYSLNLIFDGLKDGFGKLPEVYGASYQGISFVIGMGLLVIVTDTIYGHGSKYRLFFNYLTIVLLFLGVLVAGGRGAFIGIFIAIIMMLSNAGKIRLRGEKSSYNYKKRLYYLFFVILFFLVLYFLFNGIDSLVTLKRMTVFFEEKGGGNSAEARVALYNYVLSGWLDSPIIGHGIGSFPVLYAGFDDRLYPHNIVLEVLFESGSVGLFLFLCLLFYRKFNQKKFLLLDKYIVLGAGILIMTFIASMFSGDITDNKFFFMSLGFYAGMIKGDYKKYSDIKRLL